MAKTLQNNVLNYLGVRATNPSETLALPSAPNSTFTNYDLYTFGVFSNSLYFLSSFSGSGANWILLGSGAGAVEVINGTTNQINASESGTTYTLSLSSTMVLPGTLTVAGTTSINATGSAVTTIGTGGTGAVNIGNATGKTAVTGELDVTGNVIASESAAGATVSIQSTNSDNTVGTSNADVEIATGGASGGDPLLSFQISGVGAATTSLGVDNSTTNDDFVISRSGALGTSNMLSFDGSTSAATFAAGVTSTLGDITATNGNLSLGTAGNKLKIATGANASMGTATLNGSGTVTVATTAVKTGSTIFLTLNTPSSPGFISAPVASIVDSTQFVINSSSGTDASTVNWLIIN